MSFSINVILADGKITTISVNSEEELKNMTGKQLKRRLFPGEEHDQRRLISGCKQLEDDRTLGSYGVQHESKVHVVYRLRDGAEDENERISRTVSMDRLADMQQTEPESSSSCCMM